MKIETLRNEIKDSNGKVVGHTIVEYDTDEINLLLLKDEDADKSMKRYKDLPVRSTPHSSVQSKRNALKKFGFTDEELSIIEGKYSL